MLIHNLGADWEKKNVVTIDHVIVYDKSFVLFFFFFLQNVKMVFGASWSDPTFYCNCYADNIICDICDIYKRLIKCEKMLNISIFKHNFRLLDPTVCYLFNSATLYHINQLKMTVNFIFLFMYRSLQESPETKEYNEGFNTPTHEKQTLLTKPLISPGKCSNLTTKSYICRQVTLQHVFLLILYRNMNEQI